MIEFVRCSKVNDDFKNLINLLDSDLDSRYGNLQKSYNQFNTVVSIDNIIIAYSDNQAVGCGGYKKYDENSVEIKRMYVKPEFRGKGIAGSILNDLETWACENGFDYAVLETGKKQHEAIGLYQKKGYSIIENYGQYAGNSNSICMKKTIS